MSSFPGILLFALILIHESYHTIVFNKTLYITYKLLLTTIVYRNLEFHIVHFLEELFSFDIYVPEQTIK